MLKQGGTRKRFFRRKKKILAHQKKYRLSKPTINKIISISTLADAKAMAFPVVEFSREGYKIRKVFA